MFPYAEILNLLREFYVARTQMTLNKKHKGNGYKQDFPIFDIPQSYKQFNSEDRISDCCITHNYSTLSLPSMQSTALLAYPKKQNLLLVNEFWGGIP